MCLEHAGTLFMLRNWWKCGKNWIQNWKHYQRIQLTSKLTIYWEVYRQFNFQLYPSQYTVNLTIDCIPRMQLKEIDCIQCYSYQGFWNTSNYYIDSIHCMNTINLTIDFILHSKFCSSWGQITLCAVLCQDLGLITLWVLSCKFLWGAV